MRPLQCNYCSTTFTRQVVAGGLLYNVSEEVNDYLWLTNFRVLWDGPVKDDPWGSAANYDQFISECCRMHLRGRSMRIRD